MDQKQYAQVETTTGYDRYPSLFSLLQQTTIENTPKQVLSFGCSTGQECITLAELFPNSKITGVDVNKQVLVRAKRDNPHKNIRYIHLNEWLENDQTFDLIVACSVLCRWPESRYINDLSKHFSFEQYQSLVNKMDQSLIQGGSLAILHSNYRFQDTSLLSKYDVHTSKDNSFPSSIRRFDPNSKISTTWPSKTDSTLNSPALFIKK